MKFDSKWQRIFINIPSFAILGIIIDTLSVIEARPVLTTTDKINKSIDAAVNKEHNYWQKKVDDNEKRIKNLNDNLIKAQEDSKKLTSEKTSYEQKAKADLDKLTKEKNDAVSELNKAKSEFENTKKNLSTSIDNLKKEIEKNTQEHEALNKRLTETEKAKKDSEDKSKKELENTIKQYNSKINSLNKKITQKSSQLKSKTTQLKNLNSSFDAQRTNLYKAEAKIYSDVEVLKGTIRTLQSELKALVTQAKFMDLDRMQRIKTIKDQIATETQNFAEQIRAIQEADVQNLLRIDKLNNLIQRLIAKNQNLEKAGKVLEIRLMAKIQRLKKRQAQSEQRYKLLQDAYARAESQNLVAIDHLKQELSSAVVKNRSLLTLANHLNKERRAEDIADSKMETNLLLKIENLKHELNKATQKNENLVKNIGITTKYINNLKKAELDNSTKLQNEIQSLTTEIKAAGEKYAKLLQKYDDSRRWTVEKLAIKNNPAVVKPSILMRGNIPIDYRYNASGQGHNSPEQGYSRREDPFGHLTSATLPSNAQLRQSENEYTQLQQNDKSKGNWRLENLEKDYAQATIEHQPKNYHQATSHAQINNAQRRYLHGQIPQIPQTGRLLTSGSRDEGAPNQAPCQKGSNNHGLNKVSDTVFAHETQEVDATDDELVKFALDTTVKAIQKMANYDEAKIEASLKLIGADAEMPKKLSAIMDVIKYKYNPNVYNKVIQEIGKIYNQGILK